MSKSISSDSSSDDFAGIAATGSAATATGSATKSKGYHDSEHE